MNKDLISIIIPVYNVQDYLPRCIDSILKQTYKKLEIILVDDGSTDNSGKICDNYQKNDERINTIHTKNSGPADARNIAIDKCNGKYISFIDSDDCISEKYIENLYNTLKENNADIVTCTYTKFVNQIKQPSLELKTYIYNNIEALENLMYQKDITTCAWGKLYKATLFKDIRFPQGKTCGEDLGTIYKLFAKSKKIITTNYNDYFYYQRPDSIINSKFKVTRLEALDLANEETEYIEKNFPSLLKSAQNREFMEAVFILQKINIKNLKKDYSKNTKKIIKKYKNIVLKDKNSKTIFRIYAFISYFGIYALKISLNIQTVLINILRGIK